MGESFEILFWLAVFIFFALRGASRSRSKSRTTRPGPGDEGEAASEGGRRGIFADLMQQIEAQMEAQRHEAGTRAGTAEAERLEPDPAPAGARPRVERPEARAHPAERRPAAPRRPEHRGPSRRRMPERKAQEPWAAPGQRPATEPWGRPPAVAEEEDREPERRHVVSRVEPEHTYVVPGRRVGAPGMVSVGRSPEAASALERSPATTPIGGDREGLRVERPGGGGTVGGGLARLDRYAPLRRAILLSEVLDPPPGLTGSTPVERRLEEIG